MKKRSVLLTLIGVITLLVTCSSWVFAEYPERPIQMVVGYQVGGNIDSIARDLVKVMGTALGQPVIVENKAGAGGGVAAAYMKAVKPDGYTLCLATSPTHSFDPLMGNSAYTAEDFEYVAAVASSPVAIISNAEMPWKDWKTMLEAARHQKMNYGSLLPVDKLIIKSIAQKENFQYSAIPTKGGAEIITAVLGKHVDFGIVGSIYDPYVKSGKMNALAMLGKQRSPFFPEVPTLMELGYDLSYDGAIVISAPKGTPPEIVKKLSSAVSDALKNPELKDLIENKLNWLPAYTDASETTQDIMSSRVVYQKLIKDQQGK